VTPAYSKPSLAVLRQVAQSIVQLIECGETESQALSTAIYRGYIK